MVAEQPEVAGLGDRLLGRLGHEVGIDQGFRERLRLAKQLGQFVGLPQVGEVDVFGNGGEDLLVPFGQFSRAVVEEGQAGLLPGVSPLRRTATSSVPSVSMMRSRSMPTCLAAWTVALPARMVPTSSTTIERAAPTSCKACSIWARFRAVWRRALRGSGVRSARETAPS